MALDPGSVDRLAAKLDVIFPHLDERQRRLLAAAEARDLGHGGVRAVARACDLSEKTVREGVWELEAGVAPLGRVRRPGAGRKPLTTHDPDLVPALLRLVEPTEVGDPMSLLRWTTKSLRALSVELGRQGHRVSPAKVGQLLHEQGFSLQANARVLSGATSPDRDAQFRYLNEQVKAHQADGDPVISVDSKKKEQIANHANPGRTWRPTGDPVQVDDHDFPTNDTTSDTTNDTTNDTTSDTTSDSDSGAEGWGRIGPSATVTPFGVYDLDKDAGWVNVGTDHNTAQFAVESIRRWWNDIGRATYPRAHRLLITADAGGSNSHRVWAWKAELAALAAQTGLEITVCHFPPGTSKWNKIEHRLFSHITMNWRGRPLTSHDVVLQSIAATTTRTGLTVRAGLDTNTYPLNIKISKAGVASLPLHRHDWHGDWNYTLHPTNATNPPSHPHIHHRPDPTDLTWLTHPTLTGVPTDEWDTLAAIITALHAQTPRSTRGGKIILPATAHLTAALVNHHTRLPKTALATLYGVYYTALHTNNIITTLQKIKKLPRRGPLRLANLNDLYDIADLYNISHPQRHTK